MVIAILSTVFASVDGGDHRVPSLIETDRFVILERAHLPPQGFEIRDFFQYGKKDGTNLRKTTAFTQPIEQLPPGSELRFGLAFRPQLVGDALDVAVTPPVFVITAVYSYGTKTVTEKTTIDMRPYRDAMRNSDPVAAELGAMREKELTNIANELAKLTSRTEA